MNKLRNFLDGKKTYLGWAAVLVYAVLIYLNVVQTNEMVWAVIATWTGVSTRLAIGKL